MSLDSDRFQTIMKSLGSDMRALADDLKLPVHAVEQPAAPGSLSSASLVGLAGLTQKRYAELGSDGAMSMQAEVGTQDSLVTDQETLDKREVDVATVVRSLAESSKIPPNAVPEPSAPPLDLDDVVVGPPSQTLLEASVSSNDPAERHELEADAIYKVMSYKMRDIQARAFTAMDAEVTSFQKRLVQKHHVEKSALQQRHEELTLSLREENAALKRELEALRTERNHLLFSTAMRGEKMGQQCLKIMRLLKSDYSLMNCFRRLQKNAREARYIKKVSKLSGRLSQQKEATVAFSKLRRHMYDERVRKAELEAKKQLQEVCKGIMQRYEAELLKMRQQLAEANEQIDRGVRQRRQLEENLRQTLMRGMSSMQLEALDLFRSTAEAEREARAREIDALHQDSPQKQRATQAVLADPGRSQLGEGRDVILRAIGGDNVRGEERLAMAAEAQGLVSAKDAGGTLASSMQELKPRVIHGGVKLATQGHRGRAVLQSRGQVMQGNSTNETPRKRVPRPSYR